ncbi:MAG: hypothetical protein IIZ54_08405 [Selenomonadaceae bacterium]|nr:hypothetical protein [Selenomonadaceae bacterium]
MEITYSVAISYGRDLGYIEYSAPEKKANVVLANEEGKRLTEEYLAAKHEMGIPHETLMDFTKELVDPLADEESFKLALTRLWNETQVHVDWSRPVDYVRKNPRY